jgi:hypothetical protein
LIILSVSRDKGRKLKEDGEKDCSDMIRKVCWDEALDADIFLKDIV